MILLLWLWTFLFIALLTFIIRRGENGGTLVLAYFVGLSLIHVPGALIYTGTAPNLADRIETETGFVATLLGLCMFLLGAWFAKLRHGKRASIPRKQVLDYGHVGQVMLLLGLAAYFIVMPLISFIPSATSISSALGSLLPLGLLLWLYGAHATNNRRRFWLGLSMLPLLPLSTMMIGGFISYGVYWAIFIAAFIYCILPRKRILVVIAPLILGFGLSFSVAYLGERSNLREAVWYQQADIGERLNRIARMVERFEWLDLNNPEHVTPINDRMNQNIFVGLAIHLQVNGSTEHAYGATVPLWAFIPRVIWPEKPAVGGSGDIVSRYTGLDLAPGTSFGVGQPLEFYINFGWTGVIVGFTIYGYMLMRFDIALAYALRRFDVQNVLRMGLPSLALLQPGGSLMEILVAFLASFIAAWFVIRLLEKTKWLRGTSPNLRPTEGSIVPRRLT